MSNQKTERAKFGAEAYKDLKGKLPLPFPRTLGPNAGKYVMEVVESGLKTDMIGRFEKAFADKLEIKNCITAPGCTPALGILFESLKFDPGDEIIFSPITDYGTLWGALKENYIPVFADTAPDTVNISAETIEPCITNRTRAIVCVHKTGLLCDMDPIIKLARQHKIVVIEDVCQAVFSRYKGRVAGTLSDFAAFSFDSEKTMGSDIGGCLVTNDDEFTEYARFRCQSRGAAIIPGFGRIHTEQGSATRMPQCTSAICLSLLEVIEEQVAARDKMARGITQKLAEIPGVTPLPIPDYQEVYSAWMLGFSIDPDMFTCTSDEFGQQCAELGIPGASTARYYNMPEALECIQKKAREKSYPFSAPPASYDYSYGSETCPNAHKFMQNWIRWSTFCEKYTHEDCDLVASIVNAVADKNRKKKMQPTCI